LIEFANLGGLATFGMWSEEFVKLVLDSGDESIRNLGVNGATATSEEERVLWEVFEEVSSELDEVLSQRKKDRAFIDQRTKATAALNEKMHRDLHNEDFCTVLGQRDAAGRVVFGPNTDEFTRPNSKHKVKSLPEFLKGDHVTMFGLAETAEGCTEAMECFERRIDGIQEPHFVTELLDKMPFPPRWGADFEDSQTPLPEKLKRANENLQRCFSGSLGIGSSRPAQPFKRIPGLPLPCPDFFISNTLAPLHIRELVTHVFRNWSNPKVLVFYIPKLENEEEARYLRHLIEVIERKVHERHADYVFGSVRVLVVLENPRAIFRANEIMDELHPYFAGASLGWHDYLAATARLFKNDPSFRIPVKADTNIVIKHVKASHELVAQVVGSQGGLAIGGMYGVLPTSWSPNSPSLAVAIRGLFKDVITQLKRGLRGFWVADPRYIRVSMAIVKAFDLGEECMVKLIKEVVDEKYQNEIIEFSRGKDVSSLEVENKRFPRSLIVSDVRESIHLSNSDPDEVRFNVFQTLQYITDWLRGNGCVALPNRVSDVDMFVLDDLATVERSRWEVWAEIQHGRFLVEDFLRIAHEEMNAIRRGMKTARVPWNDETKLWYPVAVELLIKFMTDPDPVEFVTELLLPFVMKYIREMEDPLAAMRKVEPHKFAIQDKYVERFHYFFERCGSVKFAKRMASGIAMDLSLARETILGFTLEEAIEAASFHGDIGSGATTLDKMASAEQAKVFTDDEAVRKQLRSKGNEYLSKFGVKFLVSAKGKSGKELLHIMNNRIDNSSEQELVNTREALWEITRKRLVEEPADSLLDRLDELRGKHGVTGASFCINGQTICLGFGNRPGKKPISPSTLFEIASLSKTIGSAFAIEYFSKLAISLDTPVNEVLGRTDSTFRIRDKTHGEKVLLRHLMSHSALNMHYVNGVPLNEEMPDVRELVEGNEKYGYPAIEVVGEPGTLFQYSGGGFLVLQHIIERLEGKPIHDVTKMFLRELGIDEEMTFDPRPQNADVACGHHDDGEIVKDSRLMFPAFAAGALGTPAAMNKFLDHLAKAFRNVNGSGPISHDTAVLMLHGTDKGCKEFMGVLMGLGVFVGEAGPNKFSIHQGANDGFRAIYMHCFDGPDVGKGITAFANGDNRAMVFIAEASQEILRHNQIAGVDTSLFPSTDLNIDEIPQEEIVNFGYKNLVFCAFQPTLPDAIIDRGPRDVLAPINRMAGAKVERVSNQRFARVENLASDTVPVFDPELFCPMGKVMDSWETARHNIQESDCAVFSLSTPAKIRFVLFSTKFHLGNQAEFVAVKGRSSSNRKWISLVEPKVHLDGHAEKRVLALESARNTEIDQVQINIFPDGGLSRVGLFTEEELPDDLKPTFLPPEEAKSRTYSDPIPIPQKPLQLIYEPSQEEVWKNCAKLKPLQEYDVASLAYGGELVSVTNQHYGPAAQVMSPFIPLSMHDGFESARCREPGHHEEVVLKLGMPGAVHRIELDFTFFVNNNPRFVSIFGFESKLEKWSEIAVNVFVKPFAGNTKVLHLGMKHQRLKLSHLKFHIIPDGGVNRIRAFAFHEKQANI